MYLPAQFAETDPAAVRGLVEAFPLGVLVAHGADGLVANHLPMMFDGDAALIGHVAKANDLHRLLPDGSDVLAIFTGADGYVSPNWYPGKARHHSAVPTWNYEVVHVHGRIAFQHDVRTKRAVVGRLTKRLETEVNGAGAWRMADAPADYMARMLDGIVAFRLEIGRVVGKSKLSQNREPEDFDAVSRRFRERGADRLADGMDRVRQER